ncbi:uncharacterized protein LOC129226882 [Uloborus diversus]|uniref:uncharacterized protein LOC129226882 n=1 Tax=Uloborus diversus TaxID=327109 RepID=UPI002409A1FC|nr:uncharacterized protein LOC129226882 [Uloborus diversus]
MPTTTVTVTLKVKGEMENKRNLTKPDPSELKYKSFKVYARNIFKSSLITSFPEIASSKSLTKTLVKITVFALCLIGFIYQTWDFLALYLSYPTVVNVLVNNPFEIVQPAITLCNRNRQRRRVICEKKESKCSFEENAKEFCEKYPRYCPGRKSPFTGVYNGTLIQDKFSWAEALKEAHNDTIVEMCFKVVEGKRVPCERTLRRVPVVTSSGEPNMCYTIESQWEEPDAKPEIYPNTFNFDVYLFTQPEEYMIYTEPILIQGAVHDRRRLISPYAKGYSFQGGVEYEAYVSMTEKQMLPAPYDTNCTDYVKLWKENGGTGPLNELMCIEYCKLNTLIAEGKCIDKNVAYPHMEPLCERDVVTVTSDMIKSCTDSCASPCVDQQYEIKYEEVNNYAHVCNDEWCRFARIKLSIYFKRFRVTRFIYQPKFESVEMFSYIGGYMGMWLGLSLVSFFDLFETITYLLYYPAGRSFWKSRKQKKKAMLAGFNKGVFYSSRIY